MWLAVFGAICKHEAKSHYELNFRHLSPRLAHLSVLLKRAPARTMWSPSETLPLVRAAASAMATRQGKVYGKGPG